MRSVRLAKVFGWNLVFGDEAAEDGWLIQRPSAEPTTDTMGASLSLVSEAADVPRAILDGVRTREGRDRALRELAEGQAKSDALHAALTGARVIA